jgi:uncharacterized membrane protein YgdD (TMEM256/DUF423 family)
MTTMPAPTRWLPFSGAVLAAASVALSAYASHGADVAARDQLALAAAFAFGHGLALAALGPRVSRRLGATALLALLMGVLLFSGSLVAAQLFAAPTRLAPVGGMLLIAGWLLYAVDALWKVSVKS